LIHILGDNIINILAKLEIKGFLYKRKVDEILDVEYIFKHPLLRDIIYYSISEKTRKDYHSQLAMIFLNYQKNCLNQLIAKQFKSAEQYDNAANYYLLAANNSLHFSFLNKTLIFYDQYHNIFGLTKKNWERYLKVAQKRLSIHKFLGNSKKAEDVIKEIEKIKQKII
jgi:predicted ATPase